MSKEEKTEDIDVLNGIAYNKLNNKIYITGKKWSKIFECELSEYFPKEGEQTNDTIMHAIERIWLYLVKYNHFKYKNIFKIF